MIILCTTNYWCWIRFVRVIWKCNRESI